MMTQLSNQVVLESDPGFDDSLAGFDAQSPSRLATRIFDMAIALTALVILLPLLAIVAVSIAIFDPGPIIFEHRRVGRSGKMFGCLKFRSMSVDAEERLQHLLRTDPVARLEWERDHKLRSDPRISPIGNFLRKTSIDELPQLLNVLRGDMSIVGPRPIVPSEVVRYGHYFKDYCSVRPGITGLWQISGRNDVSYRRRVALDTVFCRSESVSLYVWNVMATVPSVVLARGSY